MYERIRETLQSRMIMLSDEEIAMLADCLSNNNSGTIHQRNGTDEEESSEEESVWHGSNGSKEDRQTSSRELSTIGSEPSKKLADIEAGRIISSASMRMETLESRKCFSSRFLPVRWLQLCHITLVGASVIFLLALGMGITIVPIVRNTKFWEIDPIGIFFARLGGTSIIVGSSLILLPVTKLFIEKIYRKFPFYFEIPAQRLHAAFGILILGGSIVHTIAWLIVYSKMANTPGWVEDSPEYQKVPNFDAPERTMSGLCKSYVSMTGYLLLTILSIGYLFVLKYPRKSKLFSKSRVGKILNDYFYFRVSHFGMAVSFMIVLILHPLPTLPSFTDGNGSIAWIFVTLPIIGYLLSLAWRIWRKLQGASLINSCSILPGNALEVSLLIPMYMRKVTTFKGNLEGKYVKLMIPSISRLEWHPFSIVCWENEETIELRIKALGDWTKCVYDQIKDNTLYQKRVYLDGPYTIPAQDYINYSRVIFIAGGIGFAPYVSIFKHLCSGREENNAFPRSFTSKKQYWFHWIIRNLNELRSWFPGVLGTMQHPSYQNGVHMTVWFTGVPAKLAPECDQSFLETIADTYHKITNKNILTNTPMNQEWCRTKFGRPNWKVEFQRATASRSKSVVGVFCCGPVSLNRDVQQQCRLESRNSPHQYNFHAESFDRHH